MKKLKKVVAIVVCMGLLLGLAGCGKSEKADHTIRLGVYTGGADQFMAVIAKEKGFFEKYGLDVDITEFATGLNTVDAIVTDQEDIGLITDYAGINRIGSTKEECNIKIIARYSTSDSFCTLYVNPELVTTPEELAGQGVGTIPGTFLDYFNAVLFEKENISSDEQNLINVDSEQTALGILANKEAAAYWVTSAATTKAEELGLTPLLTMEDLDLSIDAYYVASDSFLGEQEKAAEDFLAAISDAQKWIEENPKEAAKIVEEQTHMPAEQVEASLEATNLVLDFGEDSKEHLTKIKDWARDAGIFEEDFEVSDYVDTTALENYK